MNGKVLEELHNVIVDSFVEDEFKRLLEFKLDQKPRRWVGDAVGMDRLVEVTLEKARREGWLRRLVEVVSEARSDRPDVQKAFAGISQGIRNAAGFSWPESQEPLLWPMADHSGVREAFACLLTRDVTWRFLPILGLTETGKTHITKQMLAIAVQIPGLACGRFDFKGTTDMDAEVRAFVECLDVPLPPANPQLRKRLGHILEVVKKRKRPAFLVFDTYERAGEAQDWVENQLLFSLIRATWLRVVIAGQSVPKFPGAVWASVACAPLPLEPPRPADWFEYSKEHRSDLTLTDVETACRLAGNKASLLSQLLGPVT